jgi:phospholipase D1/2
MDTCTLQIILKYTYRTISRNRGLSLIEKLYQLMQDGYEDYIYFFSLRTHGMINDIPSTELIYIHSKTMIVDDEVALIGSANINDRSMLGSRDSEVAVLIKDSEKINSKMNGENYMASSFARSLRLRLLKEHLGINEQECPEMLLDPLDDRLFQLMKQIAKSNTLLYREIFNVYPDDKFEKFSDIPTKSDDVNQLVEKYQANKDKIIGNIVEFPLNFLKEENLNRSYFSREIIVPIKNFL